MQSNEKGQEEETDMLTSGWLVCVASEKQCTHTPTESPNPSRIEHRAIEQNLVEPQKVLLGSKIVPKRYL